MCVCLALTEGCCPAGVAGVELRLRLRLLKPCAGGPSLAKRLPFW